MLSTAALDGVVEYQPEEYTITARAGTPLARLESELAAQCQYLPFDPPYAAAGATVGGVVACGLNGPGRLRYGGLRDFVLGVRFVDGSGRRVHAGGKVVKNAAGFDLPKLFVGSCGGYGVLTEVSLKVFPAPREQATLVARYADHESLLAAHRRIALSGLELQSLSASSSRLLRVRVGGRQSALSRRLERVEGLVRDDGPSSVDLLRGTDEQEHWAAQRDLQTEPGRALVKVPLALDRAEALHHALARSAAAAAGALSWTLGAGASVALVSVLGEALPELDRLLRALGLRALAFAGGFAGLLGEVQARPSSTAFSASSIRAASSPLRASLPSSSDAAGGGGRSSGGRPSAGRRSGRASAALQRPSPEPLRRLFPLKSEHLPFPFTSSSRTRL